MNSLYGNYRQLSFQEIWKDYESFSADYNDCGIEKTISDTTAKPTLKNLYYLLYSRYANSIVASSDINRFKYDLFSIIFCYGPTWEKELEIQKELRALSLDELTTGNTAIYNHSYNPSTVPSTGTLDELTTINEQNTTKNKRSKAAAYATIMELLKRDVTNDFLNRFKKLFNMFVTPELPLWYASEEEEEE